MESIVPLEEEYQRNPELKCHDLEVLRNWLAENMPSIPKVPDSLLVLFLHSCYYQVGNTKKCLACFYELRLKSPEHFSNRDVTRSELRKALAVCRFCILPERDPYGNVIVFHKLKVCDPSSYVFNDKIKLLVMTMDSVLHLNGTMPGMVIMFDASGVQLKHLMQVNVFALQRFLQYVQEGHPVRLKTIHIINCNPIVDKIVGFTKPFMQKKLFNLCHFHSGDNTTLYEYLPASCLPSDYGGDQLSVDELHEKHTKLLEELLPQFKQQEAYCKRL